MQRFKTRLLALCGLMMILAAAALAPMVVVVNAQTCPLIKVQCPNGGISSCAGTRQGSKCVYDADCLNGGGCSGG
jgi:hypothetical protein